MATTFLTGANRGIGLGLADALSERGDTVIAACRQPERADALNSLAGRADRDIQVISLDVADPTSIAVAVDGLAGQPVDLLINNAGTIGPDRQSTLDMDFDGWEETFRVNTLGPLRIAQALLANLKRSKTPRILTISSRMGSYSATGTDRIAYRTSKMAVNRAMLALADDLRDTGVVVALAHPGWVQTDMGGTQASLTVRDSVEGIVTLIVSLDRRSTGRFFNVDLNEIAW